MVPNLLSPHPFNAPLLPLLRFRASSLSSPRREIGLMKLKGMGLSQHCGFQWHCLVLPPLPSAGTPPQPAPHHPNPMHHRITMTIYKPPPPHTHTLPNSYPTQWQKIFIAHITSAHITVLSERHIRGKCWKREMLITLGMRHVWALSNSSWIELDQVFLI